MSLPKIFAQTRVACSKMLSLCHGVSNLRGNLQSNRNSLKYLIFVPLLAVVAIASYKIGQSASVAKVRKIQFSSYYL